MSPNRSYFIISILNGRHILEYYLHWNKYYNFTVIVINRIFVSTETDSMTLSLTKIPGKLLWYLLLLLCTFVIVHSYVFNFYCCATVLLNI